MKIAVLSPVYAPIKEDLEYGGVELFCKVLCRELKNLGHDVTLIASKDSVLKGIDVLRLPWNSSEIVRSISLGKFPQDEEDFNPNNEFFVASELFMTLKDTLNQFDIIHNDYPNWYTVFCGNMLKTPFVTRLHTTKILRQFKGLLANNRRNLHLVANSNFTSNLYRNEGFIIDRTIPNGLDFRSIPWSNKSGEYMMWAGRLVAYKGADIAIKVSKKTGRPLKLIGRIQDQRYFDEFIKPNLSGQIEYLGHLSHEATLAVMKDSFCLLQTSLATESFGMVTLESLATGTPVIGFRLGATQEIIEDGKNGFLVDREDVVSMCVKVSEINNIERGLCRSLAEEKYPIDKLISSYLEYFTELNHN